MAAAIPILGAYSYTYGAGAVQNRQIQFFRAGIGAGTIQAQVVVLTGGVPGVALSVVPGNQIDVEMQSTSQKANAMMLERNGGAPLVPVPNQQLSNLTVLQQDAVIGALANRRIQCDNGPIGAGGLETVLGLTIFDPS